MFFNDTPTCIKDGNKTKSEISVGNEVLINTETGDSIAAITTINEAAVANLKVVTASNNSQTQCQATDEIWDANNNAWVEVGNIGADGITAACLNGETMLVKQEDASDASEQSCYSIAVDNADATGIYFDLIRFKIK